MEKNIILEELKRFRFLSEYDTKKTKTENLSIIHENERSFRELLSADREALSTISRESSIIFSKIPGKSITTTMGQELRDVDQVLKAMKADLIAPAEAGKFYWSVYRNTTNSTIKDICAEYIASTKTTQKVMKNKSLSEIKDIIRRKNPTMSARDVDVLSKKIKNFKSTESLKSGEELRNTENLGNTNNVNVTNSPEINIKIENLTNPNWAKSSEREASIALERESDVVLNREQTKSVEETLEREREVLEEIRDKKPKTLLSRLRNLGVVKWVGKVVTNKWLWFLAGTSLAAYLLWYKFFKDQGITVTCPDGEKLDPATGKCVKVGGGGGTDDNEGDIKYTICSGTYHKGCKDATYSSEIKRLQRCLGLTATGNFDSETESAAFGVVNKKELNSSDIDRICGVI